jgi:ATP-binding cassette subfamily B multidrug efflux pump
MLKLVRYLKPFAGVIILVFALLFAQAMADLALPGYMSDIINVGVQQKGIENAVPVAIRASEMDRLFLFMGEEEKASVLRDYTLLDKQNLSPAEYSDYVDDYPALADQPVYVRNAISAEEIESLNGIFGLPMLAVVTIEQQGPDIFAQAGIILPPGADPFLVLSQMTPAQMTGVLEFIRSQAETLPDGFITQSAAGYLSTEYKALGLNVSAIQTRYLMRIGLLMLLIALGSAAAAVAVGYLASRIAAGFSRDTRRRLFQRVESFSNLEFDKFSTASLITRTTNDIQQVQMLLVMLLRIVFYAPILGIGGIIRAYGENPSMSWIIAAAVMAMLAMIGVVLVIALPKFRRVQKLIDRLNLVTREILTGLMVVRAFNRQPYEEKKFDRANVDVTAVTLFINRVMVFMMPAMMLLLNGVTLLVVWIGAHQVDAGRMQVGNMIAFMQYSIQVIFSFLMVSLVFIMLPRASVSASRIAEVLDTRVSIKDPPQAKKFPLDVHGTVKFEDVCFRYPGAEDYVLKDINITAKPGQTTAIVGSTGSGKTTLINLVPRFYDVTEGRILVDGTDIREVTQHDLREKIGYVPQRSTLFSGTIESNIKYGNEKASHAEIETAAVTAQALDFIKESEKGFETHVAEAATNLSGGQKQRLAIARALVKQPEIYIFDDTFSAIDFKTDAALRRALKKETGEATVIIVAQRISTIMRADQIVVLDKGKVAGIGSHKQLMEKNDIYRELALSQLSKEELAL